MTPAEFKAKWLLRFADNDTFEINEADLREFSSDLRDTFTDKAQAVAAALAALGRGLKGPFVAGTNTLVKAGEWWLSPAGIFEARRDVAQANALPAEGTIWKLIVRFGEPLTAEVLLGLLDNSAAGNWTLAAGKVKFNHTAPIPRLQLDTELQGTLGPVSFDNAATGEHTLGSQYLYGTPQEPWIFITTYLSNDIRVVSFRSRNLKYVRISLADTDATVFAGDPRQLPAAGFTLLAAVAYTFYAEEITPGVAKFLVLNPGGLSQAGGGVALPAGTALDFSQDAEYPFLASGSFTVNVAGRVAGKVVSLTLGAAATMPALDPSIFILPPSGGAYVAGKEHRLMFQVMRDLRILYTVTPLS